MSQLSRASEGRKDHKPILSDLRESGSIEQDADIVMFLHNPEKYNDIVVAQEDIGNVDLIVAKHRNGSTAELKLKWIGENTTFKDIDYKPEKKEPSKKDIPQEPVDTSSELAETTDDAVDSMFL